MTASDRPTALGGYEDWPAFARRQSNLPMLPGALAACLGVPAPPESIAVRVDSTTVDDGIRTTRLSWQLPFGPRTRGSLVEPDDAAAAPRPAVLLMHEHGGDKWLGAERVVAPVGDTAAEVLAIQRALYDGQAVATVLARRGFAVLAHDAFSWGSRRFTLDPAPLRAAAALAAQEALWREHGVEATPGLRYNVLAGEHENAIAKACVLLGTTYAGLVAADDLAALAILRSLPNVDGDRIGTLGFSGGGGRAMITAALDSRVAAVVVACMMTTFDALLPAYLDAHSWLMHTPGLAAVTDWPLIPLTRIGAPHAPMLVQYGRTDPLFPINGMRDADALLAENSARGAYRGTWWASGHVMSAPMQDEAAEFLASTMR
ncbi:dienelactone hydrolase family protein [Curtobacterium ammoniigenes]|uniref:dienelactone hydrolase family protein n=1 Tax=Curtobacterium ammoniigenes TaxID=395387 RepID=UPI000830562D|nr:acetylxylan esterase [Curtobacterium ammoniigenes]